MESKKAFVRFWNEDSLSGIAYRNKEEAIHASGLNDIVYEVEVVKTYKVEKIVVEQNDTTN